MLTVAHQRVPLDSGEVAETLYVYVQPAMGGAAQLAALRPLAQTLDGVLIFYHPDDRAHAALDGRIIDHAEGDGFFLRDPVSGTDNRIEALGGSDWPRWAARGARLGPLGPQIRWPGMASIAAIVHAAGDELLLGDRGGEGAPVVTLSDAAAAALSACRDVVGGAALSGWVRLDAGAVFWHEDGPCREVAAVFLRPGDPQPVGPVVAAEGLSLILSDVPPGRWADGVLDHVPGVGFLVRITAGPFGRVAGNDNA